MSYGTDPELMISKRVEDNNTVELFKLLQNTRDALAYAENRLNKVKWRFFAKNR